MGSVAQFFLRKKSNFFSPSRDQGNRKKSHLFTPTICSGTLVAIVIFGDDEDSSSDGTSRVKEKKNQGSRAYFCAISPASDINYFKENEDEKNDEDIEVFMRYNHSIYVPLGGKERREDCNNMKKVHDTEKSKVAESMKSVTLALGDDVSVQELYYITDTHPKREADFHYYSMGSKGQKSSFSFCALSKRRIGDTLSGIKGCVFHVSSTSKEVRKVQCPLLSITLTLHSGHKCDREAENVMSKSLFQQCVKRQLAGSLVVCTDESFYPFKNDVVKNCKPQNNIHSVAAINLPSLVSSQKLELKYRVLDAVPLSESSSTRKSRYGLYQILPSTRITIYDEEKVGKESSLDTQHIEVVKDDKIQFEEAANPKTLLLNTIGAIQDNFFSHELNGMDDQEYPRSDIPRAYLLGGPPGVGKTYSVQMAVKASNAKFSDGTSPTRLISLRGSELLSSGSSESDAAIELRKHFHSAADYNDRSHKNISVIFMDECDALLSSDIVGATLALLLDKMTALSSVEEGDFQGISDNHEHNHVGAWKRVLVIAATNRIDAIPMGLRRPGRFDREICISPPNNSQRYYILKSLISKYQNEMNEKHSHDSSLNRYLPKPLNQIELKNIADSSVGYVAADLAALVRSATIIKDDLTAATLRLAMKDVGASALRISTINCPPSTCWSDIAGDAGGAKTALRQAIEWPRLKEKDFARLGLKPPRGILLHGPPGCAKTTLARAAAGAAGVAFLSLSPAEVYSSSYVGEAESVVRRAFALARSASPCILFFDEIDSIVGSPTSSSNEGSFGMDRGTSAEVRVMSTFLNEMDGVDGSTGDGVLILGATNRPSIIDRALLRPGRFDRVIYVPPPDKSERRHILESQFLAWKSSSFSAEYFSSDDMTGYMTGAEIVGACREAAMLSVRDAMIAENDNSSKVSVPMILNHHLVESFKSVKPLLSNPEILAEYTSFESKNK